MITVCWTGAAGLEVTFEKQTLLVDPYLSRAGKWEMFFGRPHPKEEVIEAYLQQLPGQLCAVVVGHSHADHALDIPVIARHLQGPLVGNSSLRTLMSLYGMADRVHCWEEEPGPVRISETMEVTMLPSLHGLVVFGRVPYAGEIDPASQLPLKASEYRHGAVAIIRLDVDNTTLMHVGSAHFLDSALEGQRCDVLFLCLPGWKKIKGYPETLIERLQPQIIVPFHFDDFSSSLRRDRSAPNLPFQDLQGLLRSIRNVAPDVEIRIPQTFQPMAF